MCENCIKTAKLIESQIERCKKTAKRYGALECIMFHKIASLETVLHYMRNFLPTSGEMPENGSSLSD